jgi:type I restriction-modification system DNA methylase subunit
VEKLEQDPLTARYNPRFLIATDYKTFAAKDTKKGNTLEISWEDIDKNVAFFYGWTGDEVVDEKTEAAADRRAADKMKELYSEVEKANADRLAEKNNNFRHELNVFFTRLLFCFFAEDTRVFSNEDKGLFTNSIREFTQTDGSDLDQYLGTLFEALDTKDKDGYTSPFSNFPYVNGSLFDKAKGITIPKFNAQARKLILDCGALSWAEINPDIFGSMFQSIVDESQRETHGMHYTSVPNIMKTIEPLFLDELREEFDKNYLNNIKLQKLWDRISKIKVFDPACGSGNFLIIAYKELRKLEHAIIDRVFEEDYKKALLAGKLTSKIDLNNFYGIEIDDFACEVAVLSLYIAKHQMNIEFEKQFGKRIELIPLDDKANIVKANATRIDWQYVCPNKPHSIGESTFKQVKLIADEYEQKELVEVEGLEIWDEIYLISNPPYQGSKGQDDTQKSDMKQVFNSFNKFENLDYISCWFYKGSQYIKGNTRAAFVTTNSITQGTLVDDLWPSIFDLDIEIIFAIKDFLWSNNATNKAGVMCSIIGLGRKDFYGKNKFIEVDNVRHSAENINGYLLDAPNIFVKKRTFPLSNLPEMNQGNIPLDSGHLRLSSQEKEKILNQFPESEILFKKVTGSQELINSENKWCIWIENDKLDLALSIAPIKSRIASVYEFRETGAENAKACKDRSHQFCMLNTAKNSQAVIPIVTSIRREYIPIGLVNSEYIVINSALVVYDPELYVFGILNSRMHVVWVRAFAGKLKSDFRYSVGICWYSFPFPEISDVQKDEITKKARNVLFARENHSEKILGELYNPNSMPEDLIQAHHELDISIDKVYRQKPYENDEERLADLFALYEKMIAEEKSK